MWNNVKKWNRDSTIHPWGKGQDSNRGSIMHILYFNTQNVETQIKNYAINSIVDNNCTSILFSFLSLGKWVHNPFISLCS